MFGMLEVMLLATVIGHTDDTLAPPPMNPGPPLVIAITGPDALTGPRDLELVLEIQRNAPDDVPMTVHVALPDGVVQLGGARDQVLVDATRTVLVQRIRLRATRVPTGDVVVTVAARSRAYGVHATATYRFGRGEPVIVRTPLGPELQGVAGKRMGRPVLLERGLRR